jgi:predicted transcriptional regulator
MIEKRSKRSLFEMIMDVIALSEQNILNTNLFQKSGLTHNKYKKIIKKLVESDIISVSYDNKKDEPKQRSHRHYQTTRKGRELLSNYKTMKKTLENVLNLDKPSKSTSSSKS